MKLKECVTELFLKILFLIVYSPDKYITQKMCDEAVDDSLVTVKLVPDWFVTIKMIKELLCMQMKIYSILMLILVILYLIVMERLSLM